MLHRPAIRKRAEADRTDLPPWLARADRLLAEAVRSIRLLGSVAPRNAAQERDRLLDAFARGASLEPRWTYARTDHRLLRETLERVASRLDDDPHPLARLYAARARELELEAALASEAGRAMLGLLARARFHGANADTAARATTLARAWSADALAALASPSPNPATEELASDAPVQGSLLTRMREEVSRRALPFAVVVQPSLTALAATGENHILVAAGRPTRREDVERTVMHEIEAHAIPRTRAAQRPLAIFQIGTARGVDDQEGLALVLEERHGFLSPRRKRELAARHLAVEGMDGGATFHDTVHGLVKNHGLLPREAVIVSERAYRGGDGRSPGLGRERVYIESFVRVGDRLRERPTDEGILTSGQVSVDSIETLEPFALSP